MRKVILNFLMFNLMLALLLTFSSIAGFGIEKVYYVLAASAFIYYYLIVAMAESSLYNRKIIIQSINVAFFFLIIIGYGLLLTTVHHYSLLPSVKNDLSRFLPLFLCFPMALLVKDEKSWSYIFIMLIILGCIASLRDFYLWQGGRLASEEFANIDYFVALIICLSLLMLGKGRIRWLYLVPIPLLMLRMLFSFNRSMIILLIICLVLNAGRMLYHKGIFRNLSWLMVLIVGILIGVNLMYSYGFSLLYIWEARFNAFDVGTEFRAAEAETVWNIVKKHPWGTGFGSEGDFFAAHRLEPLAGLSAKGYVHNSFLFLVWKLGPVGFLLFLIICWKLFKLLLTAFFEKNHYVWVCALILFILFLYSFVETYYRRHDTNTLIAIIIGYLIYSSKKKLIGKRSAPIESISPLVSANPGHNLKSETLSRN
jgi:hypothetical protein